MSLISFANIPIDMSQPVIRVDAREFDDDTSRARSPLYRNYEPDFERSHEKGLRIMQRWARKYNIKYKPK